jgi:hypothetical protein
MTLCDGMKDGEWRALWGTRRKAANAMRTDKMLKSGQTVYREWKV